MADTDHVQTEKSAGEARALCREAAELHDRADYAAARGLYERA